MNEIRVLDAGDLPALAEALRSHGAGGTAGVDGQRWAVIERAVADGTAAVVRCDGRIAGYVANRLDDGGGFALVECAGEVFRPWRRRGLGTLLIDWAVAAAAGAARSGMVEVVIDALGDDAGLRAVLRDRGFSAATFVQAGAPVTGTVPPAGGIATRRLRSTDAAALTDLYRRRTAAETQARGGDASIVAALRHPRLRPDLCLVAESDGRMLGFALCLVWPDDPDDLWIETLCTDPGGGATLVRQLAGEVLRMAAGRFATVSLGTTTAALDELRPLGFTAGEPWTRHSLLLLTAPAG